MTQEEALTILKTGVNAFVTGEPGSGKTHTVNAYVEWLRVRGIEPAITASTGIAATHIGGYTIHSWSGIGIKRDLSDQDLDQLAQNERLVKRARGASVLIIDEISMLSSATFDMVDAALRTLRGSFEPFGGMQVIVVGDFFQLPPIAKSSSADSANLFDEGDEDPHSRFSFMSRAWSSLKIVTCYLSEQHRQEDGTFLDILSAVRRGEVTKEHTEILLSQQSNETEKEMTELYTHNADVDRVNDKALDKLVEKSKIFHMESMGSPVLSAQLIRGCLSPETLTLKIGARVMFTKNNFQEGFVNGTTGIVIDFDMEGYPLVETRDGFRIAVKLAEWAIENDGRVLAKITQLPLRLAWAITIHKSQGMSLDAARMDLSRAFEYGQGYVALSRVRTLAGLSLIGMNERALKVHPEVAEKDAFFREQSEEAEEVFGALPLEEVDRMQKSFVTALGGKEPKDGEPSRIKKAPGKKGDTLEVTRLLAIEGKNLEEIAEARGLKDTTILDHVEELFNQGELTQENLTFVFKGHEDEIARAMKAFKELKSGYLKPVFEELSGEVSYELLRLARLYAGIPIPEKK